MGLATVVRDASTRRDTTVTVVVCAAGVASAAAAIAVAAALVATGWKDLAWVLIAGGPQGVTNALGTTAIIVSISLPITFVASFFAAACLADTVIGGVAGKALRRTIEWSSGLPPVVVGVAVFFAAFSLPNRVAIAAAVAALTLLNLPRAAAQLARAFGMVRPQLRETAAALGASSVALFLGLVERSSAWAAAAVLFALAAQMLGETSAIALAIGADAGNEPLSVQIWHFAPNSSLAGVEAASCIVLVLVVGAFRALSRACERRQVEASVRAS